MGTYDGGQTPKLDKDPSQEIQWEIQGIAGDIGKAILETIANLVDAAKEALQEILKEIVDHIVGYVTDPASFLGDLATWAAGVPTLIGGFLDLGIIPGLDSSMITSGSFPMEMISGLLDFLENVPGVSNLLGWLGLDPDGDETNIISWAGGLLSGDSPLDSGNLFNIIPSGLLGLIGFGQISDNSPNLLSNGSFEGSISLEGGAAWTWDGVLGRSAPGCVSITANGTEQMLRSNAIPVAEGDKLSHIMYSRWATLVYTGTPFRMRMVRLFNGAQVGVVNVAAPVAPGANQAAWYALTGDDYTVPAGTDAVCYEIYLSPTATAGTLKFDDAYVNKNNLLQIPWMQDLPDSLADLFAGGQEMLDAIFEGITGFSQLGTLVQDVIDSLQNIPFLNVGGVGGPGNIGGSVQETWDQWIGGLVGAVGSGAGLADLFNIGRDISSRATLGQLGWDILGIRSNKAFSTGMLSTSTASIPLTQVALGSSAPTFALTQSTAVTLFERVAESALAGVVRWMGSGVTNITHFFVNIYKMDTSTGDRELVHASANIIGDVGASMTTNKYVVPVTVQREPGEVYGYELALRGTGTHNVVGSPSWIHDDPDVFPRRMSAVRNSGTSAAPSTISNAATIYSSNVPFIEIGVSIDTTPIPRTPETRLFNVAGTTTIPFPSWANFAEVIVLPGAGGGRQGGTYGISGEGGDNGLWASATWQRGVHFVGAPSLSITVGTGGVGGGRGGPSGSIGGNGDPSQVILPATPGFPAITLVTAGGEGGDALNAGGGDKAGKSPGNFSYGSPPQPYVGGSQQNNFGGNGAAPGAGGAGGNYVSFQPGGDGAVGSVWIRLRQS